MKKLFLSTLLLALPLLASAYDIAVENSDGVTIYYNYINDGKELEITYKGYYHYSGVVNIPEEVTYEGRTRKVTSIGKNAFYLCEELASVTIPNSAISIGDEAFWNCSSLTSVTIPNSVTCIGDYAFANCSGLTSIKVESGNSVYDSRNNCNAIIETASNILITGCMNTVIPNSVTSIGRAAFIFCSGLTSIIIPNSVITICERAFSGCSGLTSVTIPNSVTTIGDYAFAGCSGLTSVNIPNSVTTIGDGAFYGSNLNSVTIPNSVTSIGNFSFEFCNSLTSVTIPNTVTYIGHQAFASCNGLTTVISGMENPCSITLFCFSDDVYNNATLYVPKGTVDKYKSTDYWNKFVFIEESDPTDIIQVLSDDLLISAQNGTITVRGEQNGLPLTVYTADGKMLGSAMMKDGQASISTNLQHGEIAIVKVGSKSVKIIM